jgi:membrane fusion protein, multidrug efflux system
MQPSSSITQNLPLVAAVILFVITLCACSEPSTEQAEYGGMPPASITVQTMAKQTVPFVLELPATLLAAEQVAVRAQVAGTLIKRQFTEGSQVAAGTALFILDQQPFLIELARAKAELDSALAQLTQAEQLVQRLLPLRKQESVSQQQVDDALSQQQIMQAHVAAAKASHQNAELNLAYSQVKAPIAGIVGREQISVGNYIAGAEQVLAHISSDDPIRVRFGMAERQLSALREQAQAGSLTLPAQEQWQVRVKLADGSYYANLGQVNFTDVRINPHTGTYEMQALIANPEHKLHAGQFVRILLEGASREQSYVLPQQAVLDSGTGKYVYLLTKNEQGMSIATMAPVQVGEWVRNANSIENGWIIHQGLHDGEQVIVDGMARIFFPGMPVQLAEATDTQANASH